MLQVALRPAAFACRHVQKRRRASFVASAQIVIQPDRPARTAQRRRFDEIMAEDCAAKRWPAGKAGQAAGLGKGADADHRVVAPVIAAIARPCRHAARDHRTVDATGELRQPGKDRLSSDKDRHRLDQPQITIRIHAGRQVADRLGGQDAVGIQHNHLVIAPTPTADELCQIAGFAIFVGFAPTIPDRHGRHFARGRDHQRLVDGHGRVAAVRKHENLGPIGQTGIGQPLGQRGQKADAFGRILVIDRHDHDDPRIVRACGRRQARRQKARQNGTK